MAYRKRLEESEIAPFLIEEDKETEDGSNSETEDHVSEDNVQSDSEDEYIDEVIEESLNDTSTTSENLRHDHRIVIPPQRVIRGKNRHVWATSKGQSSGRTAAINIVRSNRGPSRMCRYVFEPLGCLQLFITEEIIQEIVQWTNVEISKKHSDTMTSLTFADTNATEIEAFIGLLTLSAAMKDNHLSTVELFDSSFTRSVTRMNGLTPHVFVSPPYLKFGKSGFFLLF
ncbi:unnamed protein product [Euphydryas editha]|uniref:PiggyBac transposable element-derived protein domain-containing protein n=1 Tax=Euphydryas editha TaxID=104508 RepID=A0AAU9UNR7_EUPED|nr:unnamed protein product [Euphydryas editha]